MKMNFALILASALLPMACGQITAEDIAGVQSSLASMTSEEQAANDLYLNDVVDAAGEESEVEEGVDNSEETKDDIKAERLTQMSAMLIKKLDADASGSLSLEEFLVAPGKRAEKSKASAEKIAKITEKMTAEFNEFAGEDKLLSAVEIEAMLKAVAPRVGHHRKGKFPGKRKERIEQSTADIVKEFDKDADGKLDAIELEAMRAAQKAEMDNFRKGHAHGKDKDKDKSKEKGRGEEGSEEGVKEEEKPEAPVADAEV